MSRIRGYDGNSATDRLVEEAERLTRIAAERAQRLRMSLMEMRIQELKRQLIMGRIRNLIAPDTPEPAVAPGSEPVPVKIVRARRADEWPISTTVH